MAVSQPRVKVATSAKKGEVIEIKTLISHDMENGLRKDAEGKAIPKKIINAFEATFNGKPFFTATWFTSVSANPYQSFFFKATESGEFKFSWKDDDGSTYQSTSKLTVA
jgi:sulfur-oxidizing protein SoxZ